MIITFFKLSTRIGARFFSTEKKKKFSRRVFSLTYFNVGFTVYLRQHVLYQLKKLFGRNISKFLILQEVDEQQTTNVHIFICLSLDIVECEFDFQSYFTLTFNNGPIIGRETSVSVVMEKSLQDQNYLCNFDLPSQKI